MEWERIASPRVGDCYYRGRHSSGLEIILYPKETGSSTQAVLGVKYGSVHNSFQWEGESAPEAMPEGAAHYLEHKLFESEEEDAFARFAETGANANAYTGEESTCYVFSCTDRLYDSLKILLDFVQSPYFTEETVAKERGIIGQELTMYQDSPSWRVFFNYLRAMYHVHPVREDVAGTRESIARITPAHLYRCHEAFYSPSNMILAIVGKFDRDKVAALCDEMLRLVPASRVEPLFPDEPETVARSRIEQELSVAIPVFQFGYKCGGAPRDEKDLAAMGVLLSVLASDASPLFRRLLDQELINESSFSYQYFEGTGYATVIFGGESKDPERAARLIQEEVREMGAKGIPEEAFHWAKRSLYGDCVSSLNSAAGIAQWLTDFAFQGQELFTYIDALAELTIEQAEEKLKDLREDRSVLSVIRPLKSARKDETQ